MNRTDSVPRGLGCSKMGCGEHVTALTKSALVSLLSSLAPAQPEQIAQVREKGERSDPHPQPLVESGLVHREGRRCG